MMEFKMEEPKLKRFVWRDEDTWKLIQVWRRNILNLRRTKRNKYVYDNMSRELQSMGLIIGIEEIRNKIKNLTKKYREEISLEDTTNTSEWKFYHPIKRILGQARLNSLSHLYRSIPNYESLSIQPPTSYLSIVSEPDITISEIVKHEPNCTGSDNDDDDDMVKTESTIDDCMLDNEDPEQPNRMETSIVQNSDRKPKPFKPLLKVRNDIMDSSSSILDTLDNHYESESDNQSSVSTHTKNKLEKKRLKKRKYEIEEELLQEIKRSNHIAEKNEQTALILAAEANKLLERSNHIQERLFDLLSSRL